MQLLGNYQSNLTAFLYAQLLAQLDSAISQGEYSAGALFDTAAAQAIQASGQNFTSITAPAAGDTAYSYDLNNPLNTLQARFTAISNEVASLQANVVNLLALIGKESELIDQTIAAASVEKWAEYLPPLTASDRIIWNFASGPGTTSTLPDVQHYSGNTYIDPSNLVSYPAPISEVAYVLDEGLGGDGTITAGIGSPTDTTTYDVKQVAWTYTPASAQTQFEEIYGNDQTWAYLAALEPSPILSFGAPDIAVVLPLGGSVAGIFTASGSVAGGSLPVFVRILFYPRQNELVVPTATSGETVQLSNYNVTANTVQVFTPSKVYLAGTDFSVSDYGVLTVLPAGNLIGVTFTVLFQEFFPAYQCSIDGTNYSPIFMLDPSRPYPDNTTIFIPIDIQGGSFPITDELGVPLGLFLQMVGIPLGEMVLEVTTPGSSTFGESAQLTVSLEKAAYMNGLQLTPFTNFPMTVTKVVAVGFTENIQTTVLDIPFILNQAATIVFPRQLVRQFIISLYQQNYSLKEYQYQAPDSLRRNTLANLQATLPFSVQRPQPSTLQFLEGAMYEFGIENLAAFDIQPNLPGVFISGPLLVSGQPEVIRLDAELINMPQSPTPAVYLTYIAYNSNDEIIDASYDTAMTPGTCIPYPSIYIADHVQFFIKLVFREQYSIAEQYLLQVTTV
ncbi:MAG: hypothetical protein WA766_11775 [Candidatus Acidiferrales bacterium]